MQADAIGEILVIRVCEPRIDAAVAVEFKDMFREMAVEVPPRVLLDLSQVDFVDSSGLGAIVAAMKHLAPDRLLELAGLTPIVEKVFSLTKMDSVFPIHADVASACGGAATDAS
nr:STAS domain-containing protein [Pseudoruegeria sp. HB172150]